VIQSFSCEDTGAVFEGETCARFANIRSTLERKLAMLDAARLLADLKSPPGNKLEPLLGDRKGQHSIRVNDQFRLCFTWTQAGPEGVECVDYHS